MNRIAFVDVEYHRKTLSSNFFVELLERHFTVDRYWESTWRSEAGSDRIKRISSLGYDAIVLWQVMFPPAVLYLLRCPDITIVPMYDCVMGRSRKFWKRYADFKFLCFSSALHRQLQQLKLKSEYFQFAPSFREQDFSERNYRELTGFFWQRTESVTWSQVKELIGAARFSRFQLHRAVDPGITFTNPSRRDREEYRISISNWYSRHDEYLNRLRQANVFFASRRHEGIGMAYLEAMAAGLCVIAPNGSTMNEYIVDGQNGYLYDPIHPLPVDWSRLEMIAENSLRFCRKRRECWLESEHRLIEFLRVVPPKKMLAVSRHLLAILKRRVVKASTSIPQLKIPAIKP